MKQSQVYFGIIVFLLGVLIVVSIFWLRDKKKIRKQAVHDKVVHAITNTWRQDINKFFNELSDESIGKSAIYSRFRGSEQLNLALSRYARDGEELQTVSLGFILLKSELSIPKESRVIYSFDGNGEMPAGFICFESEKLLKHKNFDIWLIMTRKGKLELDGIFINGIPFYKKLGLVCPIMELQYLTEESNIFASPEAERKFLATMKKELPTINR